MADDLLFVYSRFHRDDFAAQGREVLVSDRHRGRAAAQEGLNDEIHYLDFAFREAVADPHVQFLTSLFARDND